MAQLQDATQAPVILVTGGSVRVGREISRYIHELGYRVCIHYRHSEQQALQWVTQLNAVRPDSAMAMQADLCDVASAEALINRALKPWQRLDGIINNASSFYPTPMGQVTSVQWDDLMGSNVKGAFFLCQAGAPHLIKQQGQIINLVDIHGEHPMREYSIYCMAKAALIMMTKVFAKELAPHVRVNAIAPGAVMWPADLSQAQQQQIIEKAALQCAGSAFDIAQAVGYLLQARFVTGQVLNVDGGRYL